LTHPDPEYQSIVGPNNAEPPTISLSPEDEPDNAHCATAYVAHIQPGTRLSSKHVQGRNDTDNPPILYQCKNQNGWNSCQPIGSIARQAALISHSPAVFNQERVRSLVTEHARKITVKRKHCVPSAWVTKLCTREEAKCDAGAEARQTEIAKILEYDAFDMMPVERDLIDGNDGQTVTRTMMLTSIKNFERNVTEQKYKGRLVVLGHRVTSLKDGEVLTGIGIDMYSPTATLRASRILFAEALSRDLPIITIDIQSAYLQTKWPEDQKDNFIEFDAESANALPKTMREMRKNMRRPVHRMNRAMYGHPLSGHIFTKKFMECITNAGFEPSDADAALFSHPRYDCKIVVYVDDVAAVGKDTSLLWKHIRKSYVFDDPREADIFLSMRIKRGVVGKSKYLRIDMEDYAESIAQTYENEFGQVVHPTHCPFGEDKNPPIIAATKPGSETTTNSEPGPGNSRTFEDVVDRKPGPETIANPGPGLDSDKIKMNAGEMHQPDDRSPNSEQKAKTEFSTSHIKKVQKCIGMLLWIFRCGRADIGVHTNILAGAITRWTDKDQAKLRKLIGYLKRTKDANLTFIKPTEATGPLEGLITYCDANLGQPRSRSGGVVFVRMAGPSFALIDFVSKTQRIATDSTAVSEIIALNYMIKETLVCQLMVPSKHATPIYCDSAAAIRASKKGQSGKLAWMTRAVGLKLSVIRDLLDSMSILTIQCPTSINIADNMTKPLDRNLLNYQRMKMGILTPKELAQYPNAHAEEEIGVFSAGIYGH
jgi:hypothetical protein